ncbi:MAG: zinc-ribbon domain-containing protein [Deltaproteobacteria bacterium]|nr:zinc-ribbon domain-containing protein [Deltaproteobacteria bacterium]
MIVTCEACKTAFTVDDSRIPSKGIKVRCSKCKHVFTVKPESTDDLLAELENFEKFHRDRAEEVTIERPEERPAHIPGEAEPGGISFEEFLTKEEPLLHESKTEAPGQSAPTPPGDHVQEQPAEEPADFDFGLSLTPEPAPVPETGTSDQPLPTPPPDQFEEKTVEEKQPGDLDLGLSPAPEPSEVIVGTREETPQEEEPRLSVEAFFKEEMEKEKEPEGGAAEVSLPSMKNRKFADLLREKGMDRRQARRRSSLRAVLLLILILALGGAGYLWWQNQGGSVSLPAEVGTTLEAVAEKISYFWEDVIGFGKGRLEFGGLEGYEERIGQHRFYIVRGSVTNASRRARKYVKLRIVILDQAGNMIREKVIFCGNVFTPEELEKLVSGSFTGEEALLPKRPKDMVVKPHGTISFMAVFPGLPKEGKSFKVEKLEAPAV